MAEPTNELLLEVLRNVQDRLGALTREMAGLNLKMDAGFSRLEGDILNFRYRTAALQVDYDEMRSDFAQLRSRIVALERRASREE